MSQFLIQDTTLEDIGDAVRAKLGSGGVAFPRYVKAWTFSSRTVSKQAYSYTVTNGDFSLTNTVKTNLGIDTNEFDHWLIYWTSSDLSSYPLTKPGIVLYYRDTSGNSTMVANADCFEKLVSVPGNLYNNKVQIDIDTTYISGSSSFSFNVVLTAIPVKADNSFFFTTSDDSNKWNLPETYNSSSLLPVAKLADIINAIGAAGPTCQLLSGRQFAIFGTGNSYYTTDAKIKQNDTYSNNGLRFDSSIFTSISQIHMLAWADRDYLYVTFPASEGDSSTGYSTIHRISNSTNNSYGDYSSQFAFQSESSFFHMTGTNAFTDYAAILIYTL